MKEVEEGTRDMVECFSIRLQCSRQFLSALQQNTAQSRLLSLLTQITTATQANSSKSSMEKPGPSKYD